MISKTHQPLVITSNDEDLHEKTHPYLHMSDTPLLRVSILRNKIATLLVIPSLQRRSLLFASATHFELSWSWFSWHLILAPPTSFIFISVSPHLIVVWPLLSKFFGSFLGMMPTKCSVIIDQLGFDHNHRTTQWYLN